MNTSSSKRARPLPPADAFRQAASTYECLCNLNRLLESVIDRRVLEAKSKVTRSRRVMGKVNLQLVARGIATPDAESPLEVQCTLSCTVEHGPDKSAGFSDFRKIFIEFDKNMYPECSRLEWFVGSKPPPGLKVSRSSLTFSKPWKGDMRVRVMAYSNAAPPLYTLSPKLQKVVRMHTASKERVIQALWQHARARKLVRISSSEAVIVNDPAMQAVFGAPTTPIAEVEDKLAPHLHEPPPLKRSFPVRDIRVGGGVDQVAEFEMEVQDPVMRSMDDAVRDIHKIRTDSHDEEEKIDAEIRTRIDRVTALRRRISLLKHVASDPIEAVRDITMSQSRDLKAMLELDR